MKTTIPEQHRSFWKKHLFAACYGKSSSKLLINLMFSNVHNLAKALTNFDYGVMVGPEIKPIKKTLNRNFTLQGTKMLTLWNSN